MGIERHVLQCFMGEEYSSPSCISK